MTLSTLLVFLPVYLLAVISPGPGVAAVMARALGTGVRSTVPFIAGIVLGDMVWMTCVILGLAALAQDFAGVFQAIRYAGAAFLLYMAVKLWRAPAEAGLPLPARRERGRAFLGGVSLTLGNPKAMVFFLAILPGVVDVAAVGPLAYAELLGLIVVVLGGAMLCIALAASRARAAVTNPRAIRLINRTTGGVMAGAAVAIAARG